ncbi:MAG: amidohydrolase [Phycicoccus sp.]|nr:amidohydrolase [Phycicoccus sp.]
MSRVVITDLDVLVTVDDDNRIRHGITVTIEDGIIVAIDPNGANSSPPHGDSNPDADVTVIDGRGKLALPGLVNLHTHLPMTLLRGIAENVDLQGFLQIVWAAEGAIMDPDTVRLGATLGALESLLGGCTTQLDMYFHHEAAHVGALAAGSRHVGGPVLFEGPGPDGLTWDERVAGLRAWPLRVSELGGPAVPVAAMPHSTYTVIPEHLREIHETVAGWPADTRSLLHTHASENAAENADTLDRYGATPVAILDAAGWFAPGAPPVVLGHGVHLDATDRARLAPHVSIAHCPGSNSKLASGALDWRAFTGDGIRVGIGTDGCSSSNDLDMWQAMRQAALLARLVSGDPTAAPAVDILRAATIEGARALGIADLVGSIEVGKRADIVLVDLEQPHLTPSHDVPALLVFAAGRGDVTDVLVDGEAVVRHRRSTRLDQSELLADCRRRVAVL